MNVRVGIFVLVLIFEVVSVGSLDIVTLEDGDAVMERAVWVPSSESVVVIV